VHRLCQNCANCNQDPSDRAIAGELKHRENDVRVQGIFTSVRNRRRQSRLLEAFRFMV
jgi:hypothetical protein